MLLADAMSRCPSHSSEEIKLDMRVDYVAFSKAWIAKLRDATWEDPILSTVYQLTQQGWPHQRRHTPRMARAYWDFRDELSIDNGLLLKGPRIIIPACLREEYLERLHRGHLSATKDTAERPSTPVLARTGCRHHRLHAKVPGMYQAVTASQGATASSRCATATMGTNCPGLLQLQWQTVYFDL